MCHSHRTAYPPASEAAGDSKDQPCNFLGMDENRRRLHGEPATYSVDIEDLLIRTAIEVPRDHRLFFVAASWLSFHHGLVDLTHYGRELISLEGFASAVAGAMISVANHIAPSRRLETLERYCQPLQESRPIFEDAVSNPVLMHFMQEGALPLFMKWGLLHDEVSPKTAAIRPIRWILKTCPELRCRALFGANMNGRIIAFLHERNAPSTYSELARGVRASCSSTEEAVSRLAARGVVRLVRSKQAEVILSPEAIEWIRSFSSGIRPFGLQVSEECIK